MKTKKKKKKTIKKKKQWRQPQMIFKENQIVEIKSNYKEVTPSPETGKIEHSKKQKDE